MSNKWVDLSNINNSGKNYKSAASLVVTLLLLLLIPLGIYLVRQTQVFKPKAQSVPQGASLSLYRIEELYGGKSLPVIEGDLFLVDVVLDSPANTVNEFISLVNFDKSLLEVDSIYTSSERVPKYCGGIAGLACPKGYGCLMEAQEGIADAMGVCVIGDASWDESGSGVAVDTAASDQAAFAPQIAQDGCVVTGCSGQICAAEQMVSTCEWRNEYACYSYGECKKQAGGQCGWTQTAELNHCLVNYGRFPEGIGCRESGQCASSLVCAANESGVTVCKKPSLKEGERCDYTQNVCIDGLECRPICEDNGSGAVCDAKGLICKKPRPQEPYIFGLYDNDDGYVNFHSSHINSGWIPQKYTVGTIVFKAKKAGQAAVTIDDSSRVISGIANLLNSKKNLNVVIDTANTCFSDSHCKPEYYCDRENGPKYCAVNDCPDIPGVCRPKAPGTQGDGNGDGVVDLADLSVLFTYFFKRNPEIDFNNDGIINSIDLAFLIEILKKNGSIGGGGSCAQVVTRACTYQQVQCIKAPCPPLKVCKDFPTPCDVPPGWITEDSCVSEKMKETSGQEYAEGRVIVGFKEGVSFLQAAQLVEQKFGLKGSQLGSTNWDQFRFMIVEVPRGSVLNWMCKFGTEEIVSSAEPDFIAQAASVQ